MNVLALIPARAGSEGIPNKNFRPLAGLSPVARAVAAARRAGVSETDVVVTSDAPLSHEAIVALPSLMWLSRPAHLAHDDTPMLDVVKHALEAIPGPPEQIIVLLQPTQPLRTPEHVKEAIRRLSGDPEADSVVSVVVVPQTHHLVMQLAILDECNLTPHTCDWAHLPTRRQDLRPAYIRDGTVYAFRRSTVQRHGTIYGQCVQPLIIPREETCPLDTLEDWAEAERRLATLPQAR